MAKATGIPVREVKSDKKTGKKVATEIHPTDRRDKTPKKKKIGFADQLKSVGRKALSLATRGDSDRGFATAKKLKKTLQDAKNKK